MPPPMMAMRREGRKAASAAAVLSDLNGKPCVTGTALLVAPSETPGVPTAEVTPLKVADASPGPFPLQTPVHHLDAFGSFVDVRYPDGETPDPGPTKMWMKVKELVDVVGAYGITDGPVDIAPGLALEAPAVWAFPTNIPRIAVQ